MSDHPDPIRRGLWHGCSFHPVSGAPVLMLRDRDSGAVFQFSFSPADAAAMAEWCGRLWASGPVADLPVFPATEAR